MGEKHVRHGLLWLGETEGMGSTYDLGVVHETLGHDLGSPELTSPDEDVDV